MDLRSERMLSTVRTTQHNFAALLTENKTKAQALCILLASINQNSGRATIVASDTNHSLDDAQSIIFPAHVLLMLPLTHLSAPISCSEFELPDSLKQYCNHHIVVAMIRDVQGEVIGVLLTFVQHNVLNARQHALIDITRQKVEVSYQYELVRHPYSDKLSEQLSLLEKVSSISKVGAWEIDRFTGNFSSTAVMKQFLGLPQIRNVSLREVLSMIAPSDKVRLKRKIIKALKGDRQFSMHFNFRDKQGQTKSIKLSVFLQIEKSKGQGLKIARFYGTAQDETDIQRLSESQHNYTNYLATLLNSVDSVVLCIDENGTILSANDHLSSVLGFEPDELIGQDVRLISTKVQNSDSLSLFSNLSAVFKTCAEKRDVRECLRHKSGKRISCEVSLKPCVIDGQRLMVASIRDVSSHHFELEHFKQLALSDAVTGLPNQHQFERYLGEKGRLTSSSEPLSLFMCVNICNFNEYEEAFGEPTIDYISRILASRFVRVFEDKGSYIARVFKCGRGAFFLHIDQCFSEEADAIKVAKNYANQLQEHVLLPITLHNSLLTIETQTISCTLPTTHFSFKKIRETLAHKPRRVISDQPPSANDYIHIKASDVERYSYVKRSLGRAISNDELFIELQPQYDGLNNVISSEVLLRWNHPHLGVVNPAEFIPIAEENEYIAEFGLWVCNEACKLLKDCQTQHIDTKLSINISAKHLARADFVGKFLAIVNKWQVQHESLTLELTEGALIRGVSIIQYRVRELAEQGFSLSIDDFGIGESNLNYLQDLPIKELKVDKVFIEAMEGSEQKTLLVTSICNMAKALHLNTVAEGIETTEQLDQAKACGCSAFQGFYLDKPMSISDWRDKLGHNSQ